MRESTDEQYRQLFPPAWATLQAILDHESLMVRDGRTSAERRTFLTHMRSRALQGASAAVDEFLEPFKQAGYGQMSEAIGLFEDHEAATGSAVTLRQIRNTQRRLGFPEVGIDLFTLACVVQIQKDNEDFIEAYAALLEDLVRWITEHPEAGEYERRDQELRQLQLLPSELDRRRVDMLLPLLEEVAEQIDSFTYDERDLAFVRGVILDTPQHQIIAMAHRLGMFRTAMSAPAQRDLLIETYTGIISHGIERRLAGLDREAIPAETTENSDQETSTATAASRDLTAYPELMTIAEAAEYLRISPSKVHELMNTAAIHRKKVGGKTRILRKSIGTYLGLHRKEQ